MTAAGATSTWNDPVCEARRRIIMAEEELRCALREYERLTSTPLEFELAAQSNIFSQVKLNG